MKPMAPMKPMEAMKPMAPMKPMEAMKPIDFGPAWWPDDLGQPTISGGQNDVKYAFFPDNHRLAIQKDGQVAVYDSVDHQISGVAQQQGGNNRLAFSSQHGVVRVDDLRPV